jgi:YD repeat-containing protein
MEPGEKWNPVYANYAKQYGSLSMDGYGQAFIIGEGSGPPGVWISCDRLLYAGGVALWLNDLNSPYISSVSGVPSGWISNETPFTLSVNSGDEGLGLHNVYVLPQESTPLTDHIECNGLYEHRCPTTKNSAFALNGAYFLQGKRPTTITAEDVLGKTATPYKFELKIDNSPPEVKLSGQLATATNEEVNFGEKEPAQEQGKAGEDKLRLPVYNLHIEARDGSKASEADMRSGVKNVEVLLDGKAMSVPWSANPTPCDSCELNKTLPLKLDGLSAGAHMLKVIAVDEVGKKLERNIEFEYFPATGMKEEYVLQHFALPNGQGNEAEEEKPDRPELAVNVMNGNLIYREKDIEVDGYGANLEVERFYNSMLPTGQNTEWGDGWTIAQTPLLSPEKAGTPKEAELLDTSGAIQGGVALPTEAGKTKFNPALQATLTKEAGGGYSLADESGQTDTTVAFDAAGRTKELRTEGYAKVNYAYTAGKLDEIAVKDPASASDISEAEEKALEYVPPAPSFQSAFGTVGTADGQLKSPGDIAIAANGDLFVVDRANNRVERFNQEGKFVSKFGSLGSAPGQFNRPCSIAIDASGNLWVADANNNRIEKFNEKGEFLKAVGSAGTGNAQFKEPEGITVDAKGNVYVADTYNARIQKLNSAGEFLSKFGSSGTGNGQFNQVNSIDVGPGGKIWAADWGLNRITQFNEAGEFAQKFGSAGTGNGQFSHPDAIEVDSRGDVFVGDQSNNRVQEFGQAGQYLTQFGAKGSGNGQFSFTWPMGIAVDNKGGLWVTDVSNNRIEKWSVPGYRPSWYGAIGAPGTGDGQLKLPGDIAIAQNGEVWVVDRGNNRVERFNQEGKFVSKFGSLGTASGQFNRPTSIAIGATNHLWVADANNNRIEEFDENGAFIKAIGSSGTGNAQFSQPEGIATDLKGNVYVADTYNKRIQKFNEAGEFLSKFGSAGSGPGQFTEANAIDIGRGGKVWVADWGANRIEQFNEKGEYAQQFGFLGTGDGQFSHPDAIEADSRGNVWVGDQSNGRVELFNEKGEYVTQFGAAGSGEGQFSFTYPMGIATDSSHGLWITDVSNNRIQKWMVPNTDPPKVPEENDPKVDVKLSEGLVSSIEGKEAGLNTYTHSGDDLTAHKGLLGETKYSYDASGRMTEVVLPNGNKATITYNQTYSRVSAVTTTIAGVAKTTHFTYVDEPSRRTEVAPPNSPTVTYDIGEDGSVFKWWNTTEPPKISLSGDLYAERETQDHAIFPGDHLLEVEGYSPEGITSIQVIANGNQLVKEKTCAQDYEKNGTECVNETAFWVTNTNNYPPGLLYLEAIVTNTKEESASERFWVNIPQPPLPPAEGSPVAPTFQEILNFREEFGLDVVDPVANEQQQIERVFGLMDAWREGDPVARASAERWGVPMRPKDVADMEYRDTYFMHNAALSEYLHWLLHRQPSGRNCLRRLYPGTVG